MISSCENDNGGVDIKNYGNTYVKYKMNVGTGLASLYDIEVTFCDISGKEFVEDFKQRRSGNLWEYKDEKEGDQAIHFKFIAIAKLKENYNLDDEEYDLSHTFSINWYEQSTKAMSYSPVDQQVEKLIVSKADVVEYLEKNPIITIVNVVEKPN